MYLYNNLLLLITERFSTCAGFGKRVVLINWQNGGADWRSQLHTASARETTKIIIVSLLEGIDFNKAKFLARMESIALYDSRILIYSQI